MLLIPWHTLLSWQTRDPYVYAIQREKKELVCAGGWNTFKLEIHKSWGQITNYNTIYYQGHQNPNLEKSTICGSNIRCWKVKRISILYTISLIKLIVITFRLIISQSIWHSKSLFRQVPSVTVDVTASYNVQTLTHDLIVVSGQL